MELPSVHNAADRASNDGQVLFLRLGACRLAILILATVAGAVLLWLPGALWLGWVVLLAFSAGAVAELSLAIRQPERDWYSGRAIAESTKTLSWRYGIGAEPFPIGMADGIADGRFLSRLKQVVEKGKDRLDLGSDSIGITPSMKSLRESAFETRRKKYLEQRTKGQREWYAKKARYNASRAEMGRYTLLIGEVVAVVVAALAIHLQWLSGIIGIVAVFIASAAAWIALKQYSQLASAYRVAAFELALQEELLVMVTEEQWPQAVADAEEAISREHTMWLASRGSEGMPDVE